MDITITKNVLGIYQQILAGANSPDLKTIVFVVTSTAK